MRWPGSFRLLLKCYIFQGLQEERVTNKIVSRYIWRKIRITELIVITTFGSNKTQGAKKRIFRSTDIVLSN